MTTKEGFERIRAKAMQLDKEGICDLWSNAENTLGIEWTFEAGEDFEKASKLGRLIRKWDSHPTIENGEAHYSLCDYTAEGWQEWRIRVSCVWI